MAVYTYNASPAGYAPMDRAPCRDGQAAVAPPLRLPIDWRYP